MKYFAIKKASFFVLLKLAEPTSTCFHRQKVHDGWIACRRSLSDAGKDLEPCGGPMDKLKVKSLPTTALLVLLDNAWIPTMHPITPLNLYTSKNMEKLPDMYKVGGEFYSLLYQVDAQSFLDGEAKSHCNGLPKRKTLRFEGINYNAVAFVDQQVVRELQQPTTATDEVGGMFHRRSYDITNASQLFQILVEPPPHPGQPANGHQGGLDHALAMDAAAPQYMLGWDWCQAMPDRATGFWGGVSVETTGPAALLDPAVETVELDCEKYDTCSTVKLRFRVRIECVGDSYCSRTDSQLKVRSDWGEQWSFSVNASTAAPANDVTTAIVEVAKPGGVHVWWPHGVGQAKVAKMHNFTFSFLLGNQTSDEVSFLAGVRTIETQLDSKLQGQVFVVNGRNLYLVGGNWIGTDQALRYSASRERYCNELWLHRHAGLNLIRVWGGGVAETDAFYDCADRLGMLVYQEFWMTGDNNGRWAGNYSWPLHHDEYMYNVEDTIRRLRRHPSLLMYAGCNECLAPRTVDDDFYPNPPRDIDDGIRQALKEFDEPNRFYISSSMGGPNGADKFEPDPSLWTNRSYSLAYMDGPYGMLQPHAFYERNPGLDRFKNVSIGFQPEIGSTSSTTYEGLLRFMSEDDAESGVPHRNNSIVAGDVWHYHRFQPWTSDGGTDDHVYAYHDADVAVLNASDWCATAQLAAHAQYQHLMSGFLRHMFEYTSAVIIWKTQSPWPALRGFLYDWYLESTGMLRGVRAALQSITSVVFDMLGWQLCVINRSLVPLQADHFQVGYQWINLAGEVVEEDKVSLSDGSSIEPMSFAVLESNVTWPEKCSEVCFLQTHLQMKVGTTNLQPTWLWLTNPSLSTTPDFSSLGSARRRQGGAAVDVVSWKCTLLPSKLLQVNIELLVVEGASEVLFYPVLSLHRSNGDQLLPMTDDQETDVVWLPGQRKRRNLIHPTTPTTERGLESVLLRLESWNAPTIYQAISCSGDEASESTA